MENVLLVGSKVFLCPRYSEELEMAWALALP
ncbi:MAG: hypothetical protein QOF62_3949 [Pyrinomonadaceae bacterium]|jgi:hypothetical protein|nr:hypothetical protein [Pyrinomonadaceae bacterium]